jgi:hypothetical protein
VNDEIKAVVAQAVKEALTESGAGHCKDCCRTCDLEPNMHRDDHKFVYEFRQTLADGRKTILSTIFKFLGLALVIGIGVLLVSKTGKWIGQ